MQHRNDGHALPRDLLQRLEQLERRRRVEPARGLVEEEERGVGLRARGFVPRSRLITAEVTSIEAESEGAPAPSALPWSGIVANSRKSSKGISSSCARGVSCLD